ncbi:leucine-rich repeat protein [Blautia sp. HCP3S3_H10_1]|uniref:leucine-rich repeat protein n=1 Tax=unclassified Blautia TaxID=2648079 RepID=UPI003F8DD7FB
MRKKHLWLPKLMAAVLCATMAAEPAVLYAEDFADGFYSEAIETVGNQQEKLEGNQQANGNIGGSQQLTENPGENQEIIENPENSQQQAENPGEGQNGNDNSGNNQQVPAEPGEEKTTEEVTPDGTQAGEGAAELRKKGEVLEEEGFSSGEENENEIDAFVSEEGETAELNPSDVISGTCGESASWTLENGILRVSGTGVMDGYHTLKDWWTGEIIEKTEQPWKDYLDEIKEVYIGDGITEIGYCSFINCKNLTKVVIGDSVKNILYNTFANDESLTEVVFGKSVENIYSDVFWGTGIKTLKLPSSLKYLEEGTALTGMWNLENIEIQGSSTYSSKDGVLYSDGGKTLFQFPAARKGSYTIPGNVTKIADSAFAYTALDTVIIPDNVTELGDSTFIYSEDLVNLTFSSKISTIPKWCCYGVKNLTNVVIPRGVKTIESEAFANCPKLTSIKMPDTITSVESDSFGSNTKVTGDNLSGEWKEDGSYIDGIRVNVTVQEKYAYAFEVLKKVNQERAKQGLAALTMDTSLLETAMFRAAETVLYWSHTRPDGTDCFTANEQMSGENIAVGQTTPSGVMNSWMNSEGHRENILTARFKTIGIGCVTFNGVTYWVQCFGEEGSGTVSASSYSDRAKTRSVLVKKDAPYYSGSFKVTKASLKVGESTQIQNLWNGYDLGQSGATAESSNTAVCTVSNGKITAKGAGTATITMYYPGYKEKAVTQKVTVTKSSQTTSKPAVKSYKVTFNANGGTASAGPRTVKAKASVGTLPKATRAKYTFAGWYTKKSGGTKIKASTKVTKACTYYAHWKKVTVSKGAVSKLTNGKGKKMTVSLKKISGVSGYQILYAANSQFTGAKTKTTSKTSLTISGLTKNKTYYVKVRAYKKDSKGQKVYGSYSSVKKIKIKK